MTDSKVREMKRQIERYEELKRELEEIDSKLSHLKNMNPVSMKLRGLKFENDCSVIEYEEIKLTASEGFAVYKLIKEMLTERSDAMHKEIEEL